MRTGLADKLMKHLMPYLRKAGIGSVLGMALTVSLGSAKAGAALIAKVTHADVLPCSIYSDNNYKSGTLLTIGMLEGIIDIKIRPDTYIMFGIKGEVYTISEKKFEATYVSTDRKYDFIKESAPDLSDTFSGEKIDFLDKAKVCISSRSYRINARRLERTTKVFTKWDNDAYMLGEAGDMLAVREDDKKDVYVIKKDVFDLTYRKA